MNSFLLFIKHFFNKIRFLFSKAPACNYSETLSHELDKFLSEEDFVVETKTDTLAIESVPKKATTKTTPKKPREKKTQ